MVGIPPWYICLPLSLLVGVPSLYTLPVHPSPVLPGPVPHCATLCFTLLVRKLRKEGLCAEVSPSLPLRINPDSPRFLPIKAKKPGLRF